MPLFLIERAIPGASDLTADQLAEIARTSNAAAASLGEPYAWLTSYVAGDKIYACTRPRTPRRSSSTRAGRVSGRRGRRGDDEFGPIATAAYGAACTHGGRVAVFGGDRLPAAYSQPMGLLERDVELGVARRRPRRCRGRHGLRHRRVRRTRRRQVGARRGGLRGRVGSPRRCAAAATRWARHGRWGRSATCCPSSAALAGVGTPVGGLRGVVRRAPHRTDRAGRRGPALGRRGLGRGAAVPGPPDRGDAVRRAGDLPRRRDRRPASGPPAARRLRRARPASPRCGWPPSPSTAVAELVADTSLDAQKVHAITGGNAFFVSEVAKEPDLPLPDDGARRGPRAHRRGSPQRTSRSSSSLRPLPTVLDDRLLPALDVDLPTLRRLHATGLLTAQPAAACSSGTSWLGWPWRAPSPRAGWRACTPPARRP